MADSALEIAKGSAELVQAASAVKVVMKVFGNLEALANSAGALGALFGVAATILKLAMGDTDSAELTYMKEQFLEVRNKLDMVSDQILEVISEIGKSTVNNQYFPIEENLKSQFRKYMEILNASPAYREKEKDEFVSHFNASKGDQNLHTLFDAVMGISTVFGKPILETAMSYDHRNRRLMEGLCCRLKELLCIGLIALLGHAGITGNDVEALKREWDQKMAMIESNMKSMIDRCVNEFAEQAEIDVKKMVKEKGGKESKDFVTYIKNALVKKYDWVCWSVRVYDPIGGMENHFVTGPNRFDIYRQSKVNVIVSYAINPPPISESYIRFVMKRNDDWDNAKKVADHVAHNLKADCVVQAVKRYNGLWGDWSFPSNCHFWQTYSGVTLCAHLV